MYNTTYGFPSVRTGCQTNETIHSVSRADDGLVLRTFKPERVDRVARDDTDGENTDNSNTCREKKATTVCQQHALCSERSDRNALFIFQLNNFTAHERARESVVTRVAREEFRRIRCGPQKHFERCWRFYICVIDLPGRVVRSINARTFSRTNDIL